METERLERVTVGGQRLEFVRLAARRPAAPTLVFLHEGLGSAALWRGFPGAVAGATGCGALIYSRSGNGFSAPAALPRTVRYMHDEALAVLPELLARLEVGATVLIGHSDGGSIAVIYAAAYPERVRGLVLIAPHVFVEDLSLRSIAAIRTEFESGSLRARMERHHADAAATFYGWNDVWLDASFRDWNIEAETERLTAPVLAIQGLDDEYGTPAQIEAIARRARAGVDRLLLAGCGHAPHRQRAAVVEAAVESWIRERAA